ncbi:MAG TPA: hypothetical protein VIC26_13790 [Marinagarivorans sp.]
MTRVLITLISLALFCTPVHAKNPYGGMTLMQFIQHVGKRLDLTIAIGERVRTNRTIKVFVADELPKDELYDVFETVLGMQNYVAISEGGVVRIVRDRDARSSPIPVLGES